ncbi:MAG: hypothetical protein JRJ39_14960 [Deltaproteobacteria bacterium]|nr:hypothetical protein [Deltaproteobacteria bacterium]
MNVNLRKSDKMIAIVGVIILIVAGVALYTSAPETESTVASEEMLYYPVFTAESGEMTINEYAGKTYSDTVSITGVPSGGVLTSVDFQITWEDDKIFGLIIKRGQDTLTADISYMGKTETHTSTGSAKNATLSFSINSVPSVDYIEAEDEVEAGELLYQMVSGKSEATFDISVVVETGEKLRRPLKYLGDKGNAFEIKIIYNYYRVDLEAEEIDDDVGEEYVDESGAVGEFYRNLCYGRSVI